MSWSFSDPKAMLLVFGGAVLQSALMVYRPARYLGTGTPPATDPRTVRIFGMAGLVLGLPIVSFITLKLISE